MISHFSSYNNTQDDFFSYDDMKLFLYPKTYAVSQEKMSDDSSEINFDLEEVACKIFISELKLINEVAKVLDGFYVDDSFVVYDIVRMLNGGEPNNFIDENGIEDFCARTKIEMSHNEMKILLYYLQSGKDRKISYSQLKNFFKNFVIADDIQNDFMSLKVKHSENLQNKKYIGKISLSDFLISLAKYEKIMYNSRVKVFNASDIIPIELFYLFDINNMNSISRLCFKEILYSTFGLSVTNEEINLIYHNYCDDNDEMSYEEFKRLILPCDRLDEQEKMISNEEVSAQSRAEVIEMFKVILTFEGKIEKIKMKFVNDKNFSAYEQFLVLKGGNNKIRKIDKRMIYNYLVENTNGVTIEEGDVRLILNRIDRDKDMLISYEDFTFSIAPIDVYNI